MVVPVGQPPCLVGVRRGDADVSQNVGQRGFDEHHCALFVQAFPDAADYGPATGGFAPAHHDLLRLGDGRFAVTGGWPQLIATHTGGGFLGQVPSGRVVTMRVADWYRADGAGLLIDNWVMIDVLDMLAQMGYDVLDDVRHFADPSQRRWSLSS